MIEQSPAISVAVAVARAAETCAEAGEIEQALPIILDPLSHAGSRPLALRMIAADGMVSALISALAASPSLAVVVTPAE